MEFSCAIVKTLSANAFTIACVIDWAGFPRILSPNLSVARYVARYVGSNMGSNMGRKLKAATI
jgi:hypothetical protein